MTKMKNSTRVFYRDARLFSWEAATGFWANADELLLCPDGMPVPARLFVTVEGVPVAGGTLWHRRGLKRQHAIYTSKDLPSAVVFDAVLPAD